jgi:hypothetical protein
MLPVWTGRDSARPVFLPPKLAQARVVANGGPDP